MIRLLKRHFAGPTLAAEYEDHTAPVQAEQGALLSVRVTVRNTGSRVWQREPDDGHPVALSLYVDDALVATGWLPTPSVAPGERTTFAIPVRLPTTERCALRFDLMLSGVRWFSSCGTEPLRCEVDLVAPEASRTSDLQRLASRHDAWFFSPGQGVHRGRDGDLYPLFAERASGCELIDVDGRRYLDVHMGWGCNLLGYGAPEVTAALRAVLPHAGVLSLTHRLEIEVAAELCAMFPAIDQVLFGKNGSDVTTWAVRLARVATGRRTVLFAGYHGWQDWNAAGRGMHATGIPWSEPYALQLPYLDHEALQTAVARHADDLAAVVLEPAATAVHFDDPQHERDGEYLRCAADLAARHSAKLVFDEIMTGFRYRDGSAQVAYGVEPDITCLGKALAAGLPLAALGARGDLLARHVGQIFYAPTNKGEVHAFAAARAALEVYRTQPVAPALTVQAERLRAAVAATSAAVDLPAGLVGPPHRMYLGFLTDDPTFPRVPCRTLLQQELARQGVISHKGYVLLSRAHDATATDRVIAAFDRALRTLATALATDSLHRACEIPDVLEE